MELALQDVAFAYRKQAGLVLQSIDFAVPPGEFVAIAGRSGAGKSTLLLLLKGLLAPTAGRVLVGGVDPAAARRPELFDQIGLVFQYPEHQLFAATVYDDVAFGPRQQGLAPAAVAEQVSWAMESLGIAHLQGRSPFELSGGEKRRVAIAGVLALRPRVLILDEPTAGMDFVARQQLFALLHRLNQEGITIMLVSHHLEEVVRHAARLVVLDGGHIAGDGTPLSLLMDRAFVSRCGLEAPESITLYGRLRERGLPAVARPWDPAALAGAILAYRRGAI